MDIQEVSAALTAVGIIAALAIAVFQDNWRKCINPPDFNYTDKLDYWPPDRPQNDSSKQWCRVKIQNKGKSTSHKTIVKIVKILDENQNEFTLPGFPFPKTLVWGSLERTYLKNLRPNEHEYINLFYTLGNSTNLFFPLQDGENFVDIKTDNLLKTQGSATMQFYINIYSDDLTKTQVKIFKFNIRVEGNNHLAFSNFMISE